jgi:hypothetical protein
MPPNRAASPLLWAQILTLLEKRRVVPIIGADAVVVEDEGGPCTIDEYVARRLEALLDLPATEPPGRPTLNDVACRFLDAGGAQFIDELYAAVQVALRERTLEPPEALRKLARIRAFTLYVTTTFDDLLQQALERERGGMDGQVLAYSPARVQDLPCPAEQLTRPTVFHLLGRASALPEYVVTEEDTVEFVHSLQSSDRQPKRLLDALRSHSLLIIGSGYSGWLARFFLRIAKSERLLLARSKTDVVADARLRQDASLTDFLRHFSAHTKVVDGGAVDFIDELAERWEAHPGAAALGQGTTADRIPVPGLAPAEDAVPEVPEDAIFVSYATEDREAAERLAEALRAADLPVWLDRAGGLQGGDAYERKIRMGIQGAALFVPVLSRHVVTPRRRFFRLEWDEALAVQRRVAENQTFILPVCIDDLSRDAPELPERFTRLHWMDVREDEALTEAVQRVKRLYRDYQLALGPAV